MASLCKNLRLARHGANCINHGLGPRRSYSTSVSSSVKPQLTHLKPDSNPQSTGRLAHRGVQNIALTSPVAADEAIVEMREASPAHMLIKIDSFSLLDKHGIDKYETGDFKAGGYKWKLIIQPNGHVTGKDDNYVSVKLAVSDTSALPANWEVNAFFSICLFNHVSGNYRYALGRARRFHALKSEWGFSEFISKKDLTDPSNGYLIDDNCVFGVDVFVNDNKAVTECLSLKDVDDPYKQDIKISNFSECEDIWCSDEFEAGGHKWRICLYPYGSGEESGRSLGAYVVRVASYNSCQRVKACYTIRIKNQVSYKHIQKTGSRWFIASTVDDTGGWDSFVELATLNDPTKGLIVNDCIRLEIELSVQAIAE